MNATTHLKIGDINKNLICILCRGYYIDATTIIECLHSFCRTCIVTYLKTNKTCPVCDTVVHKTRPHQNIRSDKLLQDLVYKLVPGLYKDEMKRRREFYTLHYYAAPKRPGEERGDEMSDRFIYTEEEKISLALHLCPDGASERVDFRRVFASREDLKARVERRIKEAVDVRYLQCKAAVTVGHLKKFVRLKYGLPSHFQVDMFYNDELLRNNCTLCDVAYFFNWRRRAPMTLTFCVYDSGEQPGGESSLLTNNTCNKKKPETCTTTPSTSTFTPTSTSSSIASVDNMTKKTLLLPGHLIATQTLSPVSLPLSERRSDVCKLSQDATGETCKQEESKTNLQVNSSVEVPAPSHSKVGPRKVRVKTSSGLLGKRSAKTPIPIAPAPAKVPRMFPYVVNIVDSKVQTMNDPSCEPRQIIGLLPVNTPQSGPSSVPSSRGLDTPTSSLSFSMSSILQVVTGTNSMTASSIPSNSKQAAPSLANLHLSRSSAVTPATPVSSVLSPASSCQTAPVKSKKVVPTKTNLDKKRPIKDLPSSSSLSSTPLSLSQSTPASSKVTITQSSHGNSVGSPTPAASASPTPAAVPIQQSQTQGSDMLTTHSNFAAEHTVSNTHSARVQAQNSVSGCPTNMERPSGFYRETMDIRSPEAICTPKTNQVHEASNRLCNGQETTNDHIIIKTEPTSPIPLSEESPISRHPGNSVERNRNNSATSSTTSPPSDPDSVSGAMRKQAKHKNIAEIANSLHKRVSDALMNSTTPGSSSPNNRRSSQSSNCGGKALSRLTPASDLSRAVPNTSSSYKAPQLSAVSAYSHQNNPIDEPLNLVKRDVNIVRQLTPGMYALGASQIMKKHM